MYAVCRVQNISRTIEEVVEPARATDAELKAAYDALNRELGLPTGPIDPREYLARYATALDLPTAVESRARELAGEAVEDGTASGRNPGGFAAACLYAAARGTRHRMTQKESAEVADVTAVTLRSSYKDLQD